MTNVEELLSQIDEQIAVNGGWNIFYQGEDSSLRIADDTIELIKTTVQLNGPEVDFLIDQLTEKALKEFYRVNQYYSFTESHRLALCVIYYQLFHSVREMNGVFGREKLESLMKNHSRRLANWLSGSNAFAREIYSEGSKFVEPVPCFEYSTEIQMEILRIDPARIMEPVLDIGCGSRGSLVNYLRSIGVEAYGFDRCAENRSPFQKADWLDFEFESKKWGTIISNQGFSNHFRHHHLRSDGDFISYSRKYVGILHSLTTGGSFHYAPGLPFIEQFLDPLNFDVVTYEVGSYRLNTAIVTRK